MAFINTGKNRGFFPKKQCKYGKLLSEFFGPSCAPGALDLARNNEGQVDSLCALCRPSVSTQLHVLDVAVENGMQMVRCSIASEIPMVTASILLQRTLKLLPRSSQLCRQPPMN